MRKNSSRKLKGCEVYRVAGKALDFLLYVFFLDAEKYEISVVVTHLFGSKLMAKAGEFERKSKNQVVVIEEKIWRQKGFRSFCCISFRRRIE